MDPADAVVWIFLGIFVLSALIALASLPGWLRIGDYYKRKLFQLLILEVIASITAFAAVAMRSHQPSPPDFRSALLATDYGWDWQYAERGWRSRMRFEPGPGRKVKFIGDTYLLSGGSDRGPAIIHWESVDLFDVASDANAVTFSARRTYTPAAAAADPSLQWEVGKSIDVQITVQPERALRGSATENNSAKPWGLMMTPGFPK